MNLGGHKHSAFGNVVGRVLTWSSRFSFLGVHTVWNPLSPTVGRDVDSDGI